MKLFRAISAVLAAVSLSACVTAPQLPVALNAAALSPSEGKVGVVMTALPKVDTSFPGADCLLCIAFASAANSTLTDHVRTLKHEDLPDLKKQAAALIAKKGANSTVINEELKLDALANFSTEQPNFARKDFRPLREKHGVDRLVVINLDNVGVLRTYASYVPTSDPKAIVKGVAYMVNLKTNALEWYAPIDVTKSAAVWDQPPKFPDVTNAYYQALELSKDSVLKPLQ
jgi:hypothetical protein